MVLLASVTALVLAAAFYVAAIITRNDVKQLIDELDEHEKRIS